MLTGLRVAASLVAWMAVCGVAHGADFDRTFAAARGTRLEVRLFGGEVVVRGWDRDAVRVRAVHFSTDVIDVRSGGPVFRVGAHALRGLAHAIDFQIDVPAWMAVDLSGTYLEISVEGTRADITAETVRGDVNVKGGAGILLLKSVEGEIVLDQAQGRATLSSVNNGIRVTGLRGALLADSVSGTVRLQGIASSSVEVSTVSGDIRWDGEMAAGGKYQFGTHDGDVDVMLADPTNATVSVRPFNGRFRTMFPLKVPEEAGRRQRFSLVLGTGAARLDLETFSGTITLRHPGA